MRVLSGSTVEQNGLFAECLQNYGSQSGVDVVYWLYYPDKHSL